MSSEQIRTVIRFAALTLTLALCYILAHILAMLPLLVVGL